MKKLSGFLSVTKFFLVTMCAALSFSCATVNTASPFLDDAVMNTLGPEIRTGVLDNGIKYLIQGDNTTNGIIELRLVLKAGSIMESDNELGMAHLIEHMQFRGTKHFSPDAITGFAESLGMKLGPSLNAFTSYDNTQYILTLPNHDYRILKKGLIILEDWAHGPVIDDKLLAIEKKVVVEEIRLRRMNDDGRLLTFWENVRQEGTPAHNRNPLGTVERLTAFSKNDINRFVNEWYRPENMCLILVGSLDARMVESLLKQTVTTPFPAHGTTSPPVMEPAVQTSDRTYIYRSPDRTTDSITWLQTADTEAANRADSYKWDLAADIAVSALRYRLQSLACRESTPFPGADFSTAWRPRQKRELKWWCAPRDGRTEEAVDAFITEIHRLAERVIHTDKALSVVLLPEKQGD